MGGYHEASQRTKRLKRRGRKGAGTVRRKGRSFQARRFEGGERRTQRGFATKNHALQFLEQRARSLVLAEALADLGLPMPVERPRGSTQTIGSLADEWRP